jgi:hypothetical protein
MGTIDRARVRTVSPWAVMEAAGAYAGDHQPPNGSEMLVRSGASTLDQDWKWVCRRLSTTR